MSLAKTDRVSSGAECSCSPHSRTLRPFREGQPQRRCNGRRLKFRALASGRAVGSAVTLHVNETVAAFESELLSRDVFESRFSDSHTAKISNLQALERLKGDLQSALQDLEDQELARDFSVADWNKLNAARREHLLEELQRRQDEVVEKERRKQERAAKRAARKAAAAGASADASALSNAAATTASSTSAAHAGRKLREQSDARVRGARATAASRTRAHSRWGKRHSAAEARANAEDFVPSGTSEVADYLKNMPSHTLLTVAEEAELSAKVKDWMGMNERREALFEDLGRPPDMREWGASFGEAEDAFRARLADCAKARSRMLTCNQRLVISIARRYQNRGMELSDLIQEGMSGLIRSVEKFDHTKGFKFSTYATWWVRQSITRALTDLAKVVRLPVHLHEILMRINREEREYFTAHKRWPTNDQISTALAIPVDKIRQIKQAAAEPRALEDPIKKGDPDAAMLGEVVEDITEEETSVQLVHLSMMQDIDEVLKTLTLREHGILRMRYGLDDGQPKTLEEIGNTFRVTRERIRQIEVKALAKLKDPLRHSALKSYSSGEAMTLTTEAGWKQSVNRGTSA